MNAPARDLGLPAWLDEALADSPHLVIAAAQRYSVRALDIDQPALIVPLSARIRLLVAAAPGRDWSSADFEERLHVSGATLRRRLADEGTSLRVVLRDARLHHALGLLQTTRRPLRAVAADCGYRSIPSFARQFEARFGVDPLALSNAPLDRA